MVICLNPKQVGPNPELTQRDPKTMCPRSSSILWSDSNPISQLYEMLVVESHLRSNVLGLGDPSDPDVLQINIISNHLVQLLLGGQEMTRDVQRVIVRRETINRDAN